MSRTWVLAMSGVFLLSRMGQASADCPLEGCDPPDPCIVGDPCTLPCDFAGTITRCHPQVCTCNPGQGDCYCPPPFMAQVHAGCGWVNGAWNVPYGALVLVRSNGGPIAAVIEGIGEYYTHSALSYGELGAAQAEMKLPDQNSWPA